MLHVCKTFFPFSCWVSRVVNIEFYLLMGLLFIKISESFKQIRNIFVHLCDLSIFVMHSIKLHFLSVENVVSLFRWQITFSPDFSEIYEKERRDLTGDVRDNHWLCSYISSRTWEWLLCKAELICLWGLHQLFIVSIFSLSILLYCPSLLLCW